jgi:hypothetical protein
LLLVLASTVILGPESRGAFDHILLSHNSGSRANTIDVKGSGRGFINVLPEKPVEIQRIIISFVFSSLAPFFLCLIHFMTLSFTLSFPLRLGPHERTKCVLCNALVTSVVEIERNQ